MLNTALFLLIVCVFGGLSDHSDVSPLSPDTHFSMNINMPDISPKESDSYVCTAKKLAPQESYIVKYEPDVSPQTAHHMLLFGCKDIPARNHVYPSHWSCAHGNICDGMAIIYGWAKNAPAMELPSDVGFLIGGNSSIEYLVLQIHYSKPFPAGVTDNSGLKLHLTTQRQRFITGIRLLMAVTAEIPPQLPVFHVDINCKFNEPYVIHPFAYRVHTHRLGTVVTGYSYNTMNRSWTFLAKGNPQWPQAFFPIQEKHTIANNDILVARCTYNSTDSKVPVSIGSSSSDEMCNLYLMYYTEHRNFLYGQSSFCSGVQYDLPPPRDSDVPLPPNPALEQKAFREHPHSHLPLPLKFPSQHDQNVLSDDNAVLFPEPIEKMNTEYMYKESSGWPGKHLDMGQVAAVTVDHSGNVAVFHRGSHVWNQRSFDMKDNYLLVERGPIKAQTIVLLESDTGLLIEKWGSDLFYMPHGLSISLDSSYWCTDVALHQVFKFSLNNRNKPAMTLGEAFIPGNDKAHFCKPASVAVSKNGDIYIADGYCNSRIVRFSAEGKYLSEWGKPNNPLEISPPVGSFRIPHKVVLLEDRDLVCVADRENARIQCFTMVTGRFRFQIQREEFGESLYSIAYAQEKGLLFAVCGETLYKDHKVRAFVFNITDQKLLNIFAPDSGSFTRPHDIAVLPNGEEAFVCEIGPNLVWRFIRAYHKSTKKVLNAATSILKESPVRGSHTDHVAKISGNHTLSGADDEEDQLETSIIIWALLGVPILCLVLVTVVLRLKRKGKFQLYFGNLKGWWGGYRTPPDKFNLGTLLNPHKGFDPVSLDESDEGAEDGSDSDVEEFSAIAKKT